MMQVALLPLPSTTVQITVVVPIGYTPLAFDVPLKLLVTLATEQLSAVTGEGTVTLAVHMPVSVPTAMLDGQVIVGLILSITVTVYEHVAVLPAASRTV
jgi:hypothetical protein